MQHDGQPGVIAAADNKVTEADLFVDLELDANPHSPPGAFQRNCGLAAGFRRLQCGLDMNEVSCCLHAALLESSRTIYGLIVVAYVFGCYHCHPAQPPLLTCTLVCDEKPTKSEREAWCQLLTPA